MSQNKNFQKHITILDECFASRTGAFTLEKLIDIIQEKLDFSFLEKLFKMLKLTINTYLKV